MTVEQAWRPSSLELERRAFRRQQTGRSLLIGAASTIAFAIIAWLLVVNTPGWVRVQESFFDPVTWAGAAPRVWHGFLLNLQILCFAVIGVAIVASLLAFLRTLRGPVWFPLRFLAATYTDVFRGTPLIIVLYLVGFGIPGLIQQRIPTEVLGTAALVITYSAYVAEVLRAGLEAVHPSQRMAARALGYTHSQTLRIIVLPQGVRKVTPALMNDFIAMQKDVGLVSVLGAVDAVRAAQIETARFADFSPYVLAGLLFIALAWPMIRLTDWVSARMQRREQIGGVV